MTSRWRTSTDSSLRGTSSGRATCTTILRVLMIRKSLFRRVARRSLRGGRIVGRGSALIFRRRILWKKKTLLHHSGSRPFSYRMDARWRGGGGGSKFPEIDVFGDVYVRPGNELAESLHILTETLDQTLGRRPACRGMGMPDRGNLDPGHRRRQTVK
ncbi:unnamed protein product [Prunus armeniaca]